MWQGCHLQSPVRGRALAESPSPQLTAWLQSVMGAGPGARPTALPTKPHRVLEVPHFVSPGQRLLLVIKTTDDILPCAECGEEIKITRHRIQVPRKQLTMPLLMGDREQLQE